MTQLRLLVLVVLAALVPPGMAHADEPFSLKKYTPPGDNTRDEPIARQFSLARATSFLDGAALDWQTKRNCFACHTNYAYLYARPMIDAKAPAHHDIRQALEDLVTKRWPDKEPRWDAEVVATAAALAHNDAMSTRKLHPVTRTALDRIWTVQQDDGGIAWLKCAWPPMENDDHYGVTLAALAVGVAPDGYAKTAAAETGLAGLRGWLNVNPPENLHHRAMLLWVASYLDDFMTIDEKNRAVKLLLARQLPDGGWSAASLGNWQRRDGAAQDLMVSDGYGTGFTIYVLRRAGMSANDPYLQKGIAWLKSNQRESGRWYSRSLFKDNKHYLSHAGSAFAVMALASCP